jgi:DNA-binding GntR family transcriptional regulator
MSTRAISKRKAPETLAQTAWQQIRDGILRGDYPLGSTLSRRRLAEQLGMSILPVSEALQRLESEGLVESRARVGTTVKIPTPQDIRGHYVIREALECQSARLFSERASAAARQQLRQMAAKLDARGSELQLQAVTRDEWLSVRKMHMDFHLMIADATGYPALRTAIERNQTLVFVTLYDSLLARPWDNADWHILLMETLAGNDPDASQTAMRAHVRAGLDEILQSLEPFLRWDDSKLNSLTRNGIGRV